MVSQATGLKHLRPRLDNQIPKANNVSILYPLEETPMARQKLDKETRKAVKEAKRPIEEVAKIDANEAETRRRIERIFATLMGYDVFKHITRECAVAGIGPTDYCDFAIQLENGDADKPVIMVEIKAVNVDLMPKHLKQISSYAINKGTEWVILTNGREWRLYHVSFGQPPQLKLMESWDLMSDSPEALAEKFSLVGYKNVKKGILDEMWMKANVLTPQNLVGILVSEMSIKLVRREIRKSTGVLVAPDEIVGAIRRILNEAALTEMGAVKISLPNRKKHRKALNGEASGRNTVAEKIPQSNHEVTSEQ